MPLLLQGIHKYQNELINYLKLATFCSKLMYIGSPVDCVESK